MDKELNLNTKSTSHAKAQGASSTESENVFLKDLNHYLEGSSLVVKEVKSEYYPTFEIVLNTKLFTAPTLSAEEPLTSFIDTLRKINYPFTSSTNWNNTKCTFWFE